MESGTQIVCEFAMMSARRICEVLQFDEGYNFRGALQFPYMVNFTFTCAELCSECRIFDGLVIIDRCRKLTKRCQLVTGMHGELDVCIVVSDSHKVTTSL